MNVQVQAGPVTIPAAQLAAFVARLFAATGLSAPAAEKVANGLVDADLDGLASHGVMLADMYIERLQGGSVSKETGRLPLCPNGRAPSYSTPAMPLAS